MLAYLGFEGAIEVLHDALGQFVPENLALAQRCVFGNRPAPRARRHRLRGSQSTAVNGKNLDFDTRVVTLGLFFRKGASDAAERLKRFRPRLRLEPSTRPVPICQRFESGPPPSVQWPCEVGPAFHARHEAPSKAVRRAEQYRSPRHQGRWAANAGMFGLGTNVVRQKSRNRRRRAASP